MMEIPVASRVHRIIRKMNRYHAFDDLNKVVEEYPITLEPDETVFGVYENFSNQTEGSIIITDRGMHYCMSDSQSKKLKYEDIQETIFPEDKLAVEIFEIQLKDGSVFELPIRRSDVNSRFTDIFEFMRFIRRVTEDLAKTGSNGTKGQEQE